MGVVTVNGLECGTNYTIIAGGTLNGVLVGPRSIHGNISTNPCPMCPAIGKIHWIGLRRLCRHNFRHNRLAKALSIMPA